MAIQLTCEKATASHTIPVRLISTLSQGDSIMIPMRTLFIAACSIALSVTAARAEEIDNPLFSAWSKYGVGTRVTLESKTADGMTMSSVRILKEKADDHVLIEVTATLEKGGKKEGTRPVPVTIPAKADKAKVQELEKEKLKVADKTYDCTIYAMADPGPNYIGSNPKLWLSSQVPGGIVKVEMSTPLGTNAQVLKSVEIKK
jgi:hypothetical protein